MGSIIVHQEKVTNYEELTELCPFDAIQVVARALTQEERSAAEKGNYSFDKLVTINQNCKVCKLCVKNGPPGVFEYFEEQVALIDKSLWRGIAVYVDHEDGEIHPVTYELIGKAREMADKIGHPVHCVFMGRNIRERAEGLLKYGVDEVFVYEDEELEHFRIEPYTAVLEDFLDKVQPAIMLVGGNHDRKIAGPEDGGEVQDRPDRRLHHARHPAKQRPGSDPPGFWREHNGPHPDAEHQAAVRNGALQDIFCP